MPVSKKPRTAASTLPSRRRRLLWLERLPDRRAMESYLAAIGARSRDDAIAKAQEVMYEAWDRATSRSRIALAHKALAISPLCADAYNLLAEEAATPAEARDLYARGLEAGELALGPEGFEEYEGHFWGFLETRPYMRARHGLALTLLDLGEEEAAVEHFRAMLKLNPGDNQGIRYLLLGCLLRRDDAAAVKELLAAYEDEWSATGSILGRWSPSGKGMRRKRRPRGWCRTPGRPTSTCLPCWLEPSRRRPQRAATSRWAELTKRPTTSGIVDRLGARRPAQSYG